MVRPRNRVPARPRLHTPRRAFQVSRQALGRSRPHYSVAWTSRHFAFKNSHVEDGQGAGRVGAKPFSRRARSIAELAAHAAMIKRPRAGNDLSCRCRPSSLDRIVPLICVSRFVMETAFQCSNVRGWVGGTSHVPTVAQGGVLSTFTARKSFIGHRKDAGSRVAVATLTELFRVVLFGT